MNIGIFGSLPLMAAASAESFRPLSWRDGRNATSAADASTGDFGARRHGRRRKNVAADLLHIDRAMADRLTGIEQTEDAAMGGEPP